MVNICEFRKELTQGQNTIGYLGRTIDLFFACVLRNHMLTMSYRFLLVKTQRKTCISKSISEFSKKIQKL